MQIIHETSPAIALTIARSRCCLAGPILGDSGMNVVIPNHPKGQFGPEQASSVGAQLIFEWTGPVKVAYEPIHYPPYLPDVLYDQFPSRGFVPVGTTLHLHLIDVQLVRGGSWKTAVPAPEFKDVTNLHAFTKWLQSKFSNYSDREVARIEQEIATIVQSQPPIKVIFPPDSLYELDLRKRFPLMP